MKTMLNFAATVVFAIAVMSFGASISTFLNIDSSNIESVWGPG
jgi:hypothetical protein